MTWAAAVWILASVCLAASPAPKIAVFSYYSSSSGSREVLVCALSSSQCANSPATFPPYVAKVERVSDTMAMLYDGSTIYGMAVADLQSPSGKYEVGFRAKSVVAHPWMSSIAAVVGDNEVELAHLNHSLVHVGKIGPFVQNSYEEWLLASAAFVDHGASAGLLAHFTALKTTDGIQNNVVVSYLDGMIARFYLSIASDGFLVATSQGAFYVATTISPQIYWLPVNNSMFNQIPFVGASLPPIEQIDAVSVVEGEINTFYLVGLAIGGGRTLYSAPLPDLRSISATTTLQWTVRLSDVFAATHGSYITSVAIF